MKKYDFTVLKQTIHLGQYAASYGYQVDKAKSTRSSLAMRHADGDKIIISKKGERWVYFSVFNDGDNGTIVDFVKNRTGKNIPEIGEQLATWMGGSGVLPEFDSPGICAQVFDRARILTAFGRMMPAGYQSYLIHERKIPEHVLNHPRFHQRIFQDRYGNAVFPHWDEQGVCGLELKNQNKGLFMRGSEKALWLSQIDPADAVLILAESAIDALSHFTLFSTANTAYGSVSGGMRSKQFDHLKAVIESMPLLRKIVLAVDNDPGGDKIASRIESFLSGKFTGEIIRDSPSQKDMDWNEVLKNKH